MTYFYFLHDLTLTYNVQGTGKTLVAKQLAMQSGLDYAIMSGGDVAPLKEHAVTEIHSLFRWAEHSDRGLVLFIDEAETFLKTRNDPDLSEHSRNALNALLYNTGSASTQFMLVLATNRPRDLDKAVSDRLDEYIMFDLPQQDECRRLLRFYFDLYITKANRITCEDSLVSNDTLDRFADMLWQAGFSGRAISKLMISAQGQAYGTEECVLTAKAFSFVVQKKIEQRKHQLAMVHDRDVGNYV